MNCSLFQSIDIEEAWDSFPITQASLTEAAMGLSSKSHLALPSQELTLERVESFCTCSFSRASEESLK